MPWKESPQQSASPRAAANARILRRSLTEPEKRLWQHLRRRLPLDGSHFRRQVPIGPYVADFCCLAARLIIEVDGGQHASDRTAAYDARRDTFLGNSGFRVLRFTNADVMINIDSVLDTIFAALVGAEASSFARRPGGATPTPGPFPQGVGEMLEP